MKDVKSPNKELNSCQSEQCVKRAEYTPARGRTPVRMCVSRNKEDVWDELKETGGGLNKCRPHGMEE